MKVNELLAEVIGFNDKRKIPTGSVKDWLKAMGATPEDVAKARAEVLKSPEYKQILARGMTDASTDRAKKNGTIIFKMEYNEPVMKNGIFIHKELGRAGKDLKTVELHYNVQPHGKIDFTAPNGYHRWPAPSGKPALVKDNPVASIVKTMKSALEDLDRQVGKRLEAAKTRFTKAELNLQDLKVQEQSVRKALGQMNRHLDHACRSKEWDTLIYGDKPTVIWITKESKEWQGEDAAEIIAEQLDVLGIKGWVVKVTISDDYHGHDNSRTRWQGTARS